MWLNFYPLQLNRLTWWTRHSEEPRLDIDEWLASQSNKDEENTSEEASIEKGKGIEMETISLKNGKGISP